MVETDITVRTRIHDDALAFMNIRRNLKSRSRSRHMPSVSASRSGAAPIRTLRVATWTLSSSRTLSPVISLQHTGRYRIRVASRDHGPYECPGLCASRIACDLLTELRRRNIVRSSNNPTGDYGEFVFATAFGWTLNGNSSADTDALDSDGIRHQIKCRRRLAMPQDSRQPGFIGRRPAASRTM